MRTVAELHGVFKSYGRNAANVRVLNDVSVRLYAGDLTLIEGPSGSGKTTLLQILGLLLPPDQGRERF